MAEPSQSFFCYFSNVNLFISYHMFVLVADEIYKHICCLFIGKHVFGSF